MKRYATFRTAAAPASRTTGSVALAIAVIAYLAKRFGVVDGDVFVLSLIAAAVVALLALVMALIAFHRIWTYGGSGIPSALSGALLGIAALAPPVVILGVLVASPAANDLSTDRLDPPEVKIQQVASSQPFLDWSNEQLANRVWPILSQIRELDGAAEVKPAQPYSDIVPRRYRIAPAQLHVAGAKALEDLNWPVVDELPPDLLDAATRLQAEGTSRFLGLKFDIVLRVRPDPVGVLLDVRSRSRTPLRDISDNAGHIRTVFAEIDRVLLETYGDLARLSVEENGLDEEELQEETLEEPSEVIPVPGFKPYFEQEETVRDDSELTDLEG